MPIIVSMKLYWSIKVGDLACESSSLSVANTASVGMAWEANSTVVHAGNVHEKIIFNFF